MASTHLAPHEHRHKDATVSDACAQTLSFEPRSTTIKVIHHCTGYLQAETHFDYLQSKLLFSRHKDSKICFQVFLALQQAEKGQQ